MINVNHSPNIDSTIITDRDSYIVTLVKGKTVLHLGCVDSGFTEERVADGSLLHLQLQESCDDLYGIDIDCDGIDFLKTKGIGNLFCVNIADNDSANCTEFIRKMHLDYIVVGEVLEHLSDPGQFIKAIAILAKKYTSKVIFTVPNAFALFRFKKLLRGIEHVHEDHLRYYSPRTIEAALQREGMSIESMSGYIRLSEKSFLKSKTKITIYTLLGKNRGFFADGIIAVVDCTQ